MSASETAAGGRGGRERIACAAAALLATVALSAPVAAHVRIDPQDRILKSIGVDEHIGGQVPRNVRFRDDAGTIVQLGDFFGHGPILLTLNYYTCPMLCPLTLHNLLDETKQVEGISLTKDYRIVTVSFDPTDTVARAREQAAKLRGGMQGIPDSPSRWPFLVGDPESIAAVTRAVGFRYRKVEKEFAHPDVMVVLTSQGKISRYLYGMEQNPTTLKLGLIEAADGKIGTSQVLNQVLLYCFQYDPVGKKYALYARNVMKAGGVLTLVLLGTLYVVLWRKRRAVPGSPDGGEG